LTNEEYWARIKRIPLHPDKDSVDGDAVWCWTAEQQQVRIDKPDRHTSEARRALIEFYETFHGKRGFN